MLNGAGVKSKELVDEARRERYAIIIYLVLKEELSHAAMKMSPPAGLDPREFRRPVTKVDYDTSPFEVLAKELLRELVK